MTKKIFRSILCAAAVVLLASVVLIMGALYDYFAAVQKSQVRDELALSARAVEAGGMAYLTAMTDANCRLTLVGADGTVLYDSKQGNADMENHAARAEIRAALDSGYGESVRISATLLERTIYCAQRLSDGNVLRISVSHATVPSLVLGMLQPILLVFAAALILSAVLAGRLSRRIVEPMNALDLAHPLENDAYDELSPLLTHIEMQRRRIDEQIAELHRRQNEFSSVVRNMKEGLILLDKGGTVLSVNAAAEEFLAADASCVGRDFFTVERAYEIGNVVRDAFANGHSDLRVERGGKVYELNVSRITADGETVGAVLLAVDATDKVFAERRRREFTANVSHELKTPLQSILGSAELLENGMVRTEDVSQFAGRIRAEAKRLVSLIEDIIRLSRLDERGQMQRESVDLYDMAKTEVAALASIAAQKQVRIALDGDPVRLCGVPQLLHEILSNLCTNAVKYNVPGGSVTVTVREDSENAVLTVADTGIGIPKEAQSRVFERFYRVDKSHSKETGGTGLGLSIVKHAVEYMNGGITLTSAPDAGSTFTVTLPKKK